MKTIQLTVAFGALALSCAAMASQQPAASTVALDAPAILAKAEKAEKAEKREKAEKTEKVGAWTLDQLLAKAEKAEKAEKKEKKEKAEKTEKVGAWAAEELVAKNGVERSHGGRPRPAGKRGA